MDPVVFTPRLKLTLVTKAGRGSPELGWFHELRTNKEVTFWSIHGPSKTIEDTERIMKDGMPINDGDKEDLYKVAFAVHEVIEPAKGELQPVEQGEKSTQFIGFVTVKAVSDDGDASRFLALPEEFILPASAATTTLTVEVGYGFLPTAWGKGYATESVVGMFESCKRARSFWAPYSKLYVRAIVHEENVASLRVMEKSGMARKGIYDWNGEAIFHGGKWRPQNSLHIFAMYLLE